MSTPYRLLERAGPRLKPLKQVHAHLLKTRPQNIDSLLTKLAILSCSSRNSSNYTKRIALSIPDPDSYLFNSLIRISSFSPFYRKDALFFYNALLFYQLPLSNYTFTSLVKSCGTVTGLESGKRVHCQVVVNGFGSDCYVQAGLVAFYGKCGTVSIARKVFDEMPQRSVVAWNCMISAYEQNGFAKEAVEVFKLMKKEGIFEGDSVTFVGVVSACAQLGVIELGSWVYGCVVSSRVEVSVILGTALVNMFSRCGDVRKAREVFDGMKERNVVAWTAMISGYGTHGYGRDGLELYKLMLRYGPPPNEVTFVALLSGCAHAGMVDEGRRIFSSMTTDHGVIPGVEHHVCMVDLLGRAGFFSEAYDYIQRMKKPCPAVWTALLGACKMHKNVDLGVEAAEQLLAIEPDNPGHYVLLSNVYASAGKMEKVEMIRNKMIRKKLKKHVGYSIIEVDQETHLFSMGDKSHPETGVIYTYLDDLMKRISDAGYVPAQESVLHELEEEEREYALRYHSEKLAIAYGLLKAKNASSVIRVVKNLRMCEDCHLAIKFISSMTNREIVVRDKLRFHHFKDGACSCADYW